MKIGLGFGRKFLLMQTVCVFTWSFAVQGAACASAGVGDGNSGASKELNLAVVESILSEPANQAIKVFYANYLLVPCEIMPYVLYPFIKRGEWADVVNFYKYSTRTLPQMGGCLKRGDVKEEKIERPKLYDVMLHVMRLIANDVLLENVYKRLPIFDGRYQTDDVVEAVRNILGKCPLDHSRSYMNGESLMFTSFIKRFVGVDKALDVPLQSELFLKLEEKRLTHAFSQVCVQVSDADRDTIPARELPPAESCPVYPGLYSCATRLAQQANGGEQANDTQAIDTIYSLLLETVPEEGLDKKPYVQYCSDALHCFIKQGLFKDYVFEPGTNGSKISKECLGKYFRDHYAKYIKKLDNEMDRLYKERDQNVKEFDKQFQKLLDENRSLMSELFCASRHYWTRIKPPLDAITQDPTCLDRVMLPLVLAYNEEAGKLVRNFWEDNLVSEYKRVLDMDFAEREIVLGDLKKTEREQHGVVFRLDCERRLQEIEDAKAQKALLRLQRGLASKKVELESAEKTVRNGVEAAEISERTQVLTDFNRILRSARNKEAKKNLKRQAVVVDTLEETGVQAMPTIKTKELKVPVASVVVPSCQSVGESTGVMAMPALDDLHAVKVCASKRLPKTSFGRGKLVSVNWGGAAADIPSSSQVHAGAATGVSGDVVDPKVKYNNTGQPLGRAPFASDLVLSSKPLDEPTCVIAGSTSDVVRGEKFYAPIRVFRRPPQVSAEAATNAYSNIVNPTVQNNVRPLKPVPSKQSDMVCRYHNDPYNNQSSRVACTKNGMIIPPTSNPRA